MKINEFAQLKGQVLKSIKQVGSDEIHMELESGEKFKLYHEQDCCECVTVEDITGNLEDLVGSPLLMAEEVSNSDEPGIGYSEDSPHESYTWTYYKFATIKGYVTIRFYGYSNGYYSERVTFGEVT